MPVHWGGASPEMDKIMKIAKMYKLHVVEDLVWGLVPKLIKNHQVLLEQLMHLVCIH